MKSSFNRSLALAFGSSFFIAFCACGGTSDTYSTNSFSDAFVTTGPNGDLSGKNFGAAGALAVAAGALPNGQFQSVLLFDLTGARNSFNLQFGVGNWNPQVTLRLTAALHSNPLFNLTAAGQFKVSLMLNTTWAEGTGTGGSPKTDGISYNSLQNAINNGDNSDLGSFTFTGGSSGANDYVLNLSSGLSTLLTSSDPLDRLCLRLYAADDNVSYLFDSRSGGSSQDHPQLIVTVPEPGSLPLWAAGLPMLLLWRRSNRSKRS